MPYWRPDRRVAPVTSAGPFLAGHELVGPAYSFDARSVRSRMYAAVVRAAVEGPPHRSVTSNEAAGPRMGRQRGGFCAANRFEVTKGTARRHTFRDAGGVGSEA